MKDEKDLKLINKIEDLSSQLSHAGKALLLSKMFDAKDHYRNKKEWNFKENTALRVFFNKIHPDELCEAFMCSYTSLMRQAHVLGLATLSEGRFLEAEDVERFVKALAKHPAKELCEIYGIDYDINEYHTISDEKSESIKRKLSQGDLFND